MVIITGTSRGIGKATAELYLSRKEKVIGIGRNATIENDNYEHLFCDLSDPKSVEALSLPQINEPVMFIHNAGVLGKVGRFSELSSSSHAEVMQVNYSSGVTLLKKLLAASGSHEVVTLFISSGAGKRPIASWAGYCASKAAVDLFLETIQAEENEKAHSLLTVYSFSPGVVDTAMQAQIRSTNANDFSAIQRFKDLHENAELADPKIVAQKIVTLLSQKPKGKVCWNSSDVE